MRKSEVLLALALLGWAATSLWLWTELRSERIRNAELSDRQESQSAPESEARSATGTPLPAAASSAPPPSNYSPATSTVREDSGKEEDYESTLRRMMKDPKYREAWRAQQRINHALRRENVIRLLGLTPAQADGVIEVEIDRQLAWLEQATSEPVPDNYAEQRRALQERYEREDQQRLRELLGEKKRAELQQYMESRYTRNMVDQFRTSLVGADAMREDQVEPLISALHAESAQMQKELIEYRDSTQWEDSDSALRYDERRREMLKAPHERMHTAAAPILSSAQLKHLDAWLKREYDRQEAESKMQRVWSKVNAAGAGASAAD